MAPIALSGAKKSPGTFSVPLNIRCSKRWAKPVLPAGSLVDPTSYHTPTATTGVRRSVWTTTRRPLSSVKVLNGMSSGAIRSWRGAMAAGADGVAATAGTLRMAVVTAESRNLVFMADSLSESGCGEGAPRSGQSGMSWLTWLAPALHQSCTSLAASSRRQIGRTFGRLDAAVYEPAAWNSRSAAIGSTVPGACLSAAICAA